MYPPILKTVLNAHDVLVDDTTLDNIWNDIKSMMIEYECPDDCIENILNTENLDTYERGLFLDFMAKAIAGMPYWVTNGDSIKYKRSFCESMNEGLKQYNIGNTESDQ